MFTQELQPLSFARTHWIPYSGTGTPVTPSTVWRWVTKGVECGDVGRIRLQVWYVGRSPQTTEAAVREFISAVTAARLARMQQRNQQAADVTDEELAAVGLSRKGARP